MPERKTKKEEKLKMLLQDGRSFYHTQDLAVLWDISNPNTLHTTINRYVKRGLLNSIYRGFYCKIPLKEANPFELGLAALRGYGYISTESVLLENGIIFQDIKYITLVSGTSKRFKIAGHNFLVRKIKNEYLYNGEGIVFSGNIRKASLERAVADMLYFNPSYYFDASKSINQERVKEIQKIVGY